MPDYGQKATDAEFRRLRAKINDIYKQAYKEIEQKGREFAQGHARREAQMRQMVADGKMTQADFDAWMRGQVFQGEQWQKKKQQMADTLYHADQVAQEMVNDSRYNVFAANANYMGYSLEHDAGIKTNFGLYDADSVRRLVKKEPDLLPPKKMVGKDKSYQWYNRQVQTAITQGIIQGESLDKIAHRIGKQTGETSMTAMLRNARTMQTGAQNAGRIEGLHQAQELGIKVKKQWMATLDSHTRDAHAELDGQIRDVDEPFEVDGMEIDYPGDPSADPSLVWNCRCTLVYVYPEYPNSMERRDNETGENVGDMTYREWEHWKQTGEKPEREPSYRTFDDTAKVKTEVVGRMEMGGKVIKEGRTVEYSVEYNGDGSATTEFFTQNSNNESLIAEMTTDEKKAFKDMWSKGKFMRGQQYGDFADMKPKEQQATRIFDKYLDRAKLSEGIQVTRLSDAQLVFGAGTSSGTIAEFAEMKGKQIICNANMSFSAAAEGLRISYTGNAPTVEYVLKVPGGTTGAGMYIGDKSINVWGAKQREFMTNRNIWMTVGETTYDANRGLFRVELEYGGLMEHVY